MKFIAIKTRGGAILRSEPLALYGSTFGAKRDRW
jgi:hypothetical protein